VSAKEDLVYILKNINGRIRIKVLGFKEACTLNNIDYIEANYKIGLRDSYFAGLLDTKGSIDIDGEDHIVTCNLYLKNTEYTSKLNFDNLLGGSFTPSVYLYNKHPKLKYRSISFEFKNNEKLCYLIDYFKSANLSSESKFYKIKKSQYFLEIRKYRKYPLGSIERQIFDDFLED
jgi:hypothetical protein